MRTLVALGLLPLAGCGFGGDERMIQSGRADGIVLQASDLGPGYRQIVV